MSKNRAELKSYFVKNAIPTESQFAELIESSLSQVDDGVFKRGTDALGVAAATGDEKRVLGLYATPTATGAEWTVCLNPKLNAAAAAGKPGFGINDGAGNSRLFISPTGNIGVGTNDPKAKLDVAGDVTTSGAMYCGNADLYFSRTDHLHTAIGNAAGWAAIENAKNFDALMILGRMSGNTRKVRMWDWVQVDGRFRVASNAGVMDLEGTDHCYIQWYPKGTAAGRKGWIGYGGAGTDTLSITNEAAGGVQINNPLTVSGVVSAPAGVIFEGAVAHIQRDGALYRNTDGQCYLAVDDNLYIRIGAAVGAQFGAGGSFSVNGDVTLRGSTLKNSS
ncbi:MAG TPA: hypothetical protein VHP33_15420, partial [Polyangiaceae bacterium]|nr:hypothetical protein [Polyangiaceae bacterium]